MSHKPIRIIFTAGGTGGHIFPAIAVANELKKIAPDTQILFVGANGRMEMEKVPQAGYSIEGLNISGLQRRLTIKNLLVPFRIISSLIKANRIIRRFKPDVIAGFGGYASGPVMRRAAARKIPSLIQEQNSFPGLTNRILAKKADKICVAYEGMEKFFPAHKIILTGNPVRQDILNTELLRAEPLSFFNISSEKVTVFAVGGSLGAKTINESIAQLLPWFEENKLQLIWQTGKQYSTQAESLVLNHANQGIQASAFIQRMDLAYAAADIIISRAGAIAISEICLVKKPVILIPSPNVSDDHQTKNALALVKNNAAIMLKDIEARTNLKTELEKLIHNKELQQQMRTHLSSMGKPDAAHKITEAIIELTRIKIS